MVLLNDNKLWILAFIFSGVNSQSVCSICGEGKAVQNPSAVYSFPGQPAISCGDLQNEGQLAQIPADECSLYPQLIGVLCNCQPGTATAIPAPVGPPVAPPTPGGCSICGAGKAVTNPTAIFNFPGQQAISCGELQDDGNTGQLSNDQCSLYPDLLSVLCDCKPTAPTATPPVAPPTPGGCSICGDGKQVTDFDAIFNFPGQAPISCGDLQNDGNTGQLSNDQCALYPDLLSVLCDCKEMTPTVPTTPPPPTVSPTAVGGCSICGEGKQVTKPGAIFVFPGAPATSCGDLENNGKEGLISQGECKILPGLIGVLCECTVIPTPIPTVLPPPTLPPIEQPTESPVALPPPTVPPTAVGGCSICGDGKAVTKPDAIFSFPGQPSTSCGDLENDGRQGLLTQGECGFLPALVESLCVCTPIDLITPAPTSRPPATRRPTRAPIPVILPSTPQPTDGCSVCGEGKTVTIPDAVFIFPGQPSITCEILQDSGEIGIITNSECVFIPPLINDLCGCQPIAPINLTRPPTNVPVPPTTIISPVIAPIAPSPVLDGDDDDDDNSPTRAPSLISGCSVCGDGKAVTKPDEIFAFPAQPATSCADLESEGKRGLISRDQCNFLPFVIGSLCGCQAITSSPVAAAPKIRPTTSPVTAAPVTSAPVTAAPVAI